MSDEKHTPGPWELWDGCSWRRFGSKATMQTVCEPVRAPDGHPDLWFRNGGPDGPDALLMKESPRLYAALRDVLPYAEACIGPTWRATPPHDSVIDEARAALAAARGEQA